MLPKQFTEFSEEADPFLTQPPQQSTLHEMTKQQCSGEACATPKDSGYSNEYQRTACLTADESSTTRKLEKHRLLSLNFSNPCNFIQHELNSAIMQLNDCGNAINDLRNNQAAALQKTAYLPPTIEALITEISSLQATISKITNQLVAISSVYLLHPFEIYVLKSLLIV